MVSAFAAWLLLVSYFSSSLARPGKPDSETTGPAVKSQHLESDVFDPFSTEDLSDTPRSFPTFGRQVPLHFAGRKEAKAKEEEREEIAKKEEEELVGSTGIPLWTAEADDEDDKDEDLNFARWRDSGMGTSVDDGDRRGVNRRRRAIFEGNGRV